jgi:phosphoribosylaminoimidazolecarboxamide formyltransferase/IMP cyclohydrolase
MQITQALILDDGHAVVDLLPCLEELGLQIRKGNSDKFIKSIICGELDLAGTLVVYNEHDGISRNDAYLIKEAVNAGCPVVGSGSGPRLDSAIRDIKETGSISVDSIKRHNSLAIYRCIQADSTMLSSLEGNGIGSDYLVMPYEKVQDLRYGENWHQRAAIYRSAGGLGLYDAKKVNGKAMSYNNVVDAETVLEMLIDLSSYDGQAVDRPLCVIVKHANPCGVAYGADLKQAYLSAFATDPKSAFGGVIGFSRKVDVDTARAIGDSFVEVLLAPGFEPEAQEILTKNKPNRRVLDLGDILCRKDELYAGCFSRTVFGGLLSQEYDTGDIKEWRIVTSRAPTKEENAALRFAWKVTKYVKSNALVYATADRTIGIGSGQVSRVDSARFGAEKAEEHGLDTRGTVAATDSFFPFRDGLDSCHNAGATAVVHPGGSIRDVEVILAADEHGMAMVFTGMRHFRH